MVNTVDYNKIYFVGIGGVSMSSLALIAKAHGKTVLGYDRTESAETEMLIKNGVAVSYSTDAPLLDGVDLLVYTAAVGLDHPIIKEALERNIRVIRRAEFLGAIAAEYSVSIGVAGTHGKSTTSGMISYIFSSVKSRSPSFAVGAFLPFAGAYYKIGTDDTFIFEADEYKDSFLEFYPTTAVVLNVYPDHPDYFKSLNQEIRSFGKYLSHGKKAIINKDSENAVNAAKELENEVYYFSVKENADYYADNINVDSGFGKFDLHYPGGCVEINLSVPGEHNIANAVAAFAACHQNGLTPEETAKGINEYRGVARRFEIFAEYKNAKLVSDYAHHPDEIAACLDTARKLTKGRVIVIFQPHTFSRLKALFENFVTSLSLADKIAVTEVFSARETDTCGVNGKLLAEKCNADYCPNLSDCAEYIKKNALPNDTVILIGAGDIDKVRFFFTNIPKN